METIKNDIDAINYSLSYKYENITRQNSLTLESMGALFYFFEQNEREIEINAFMVRFNLSRMKMQRIMKNLERAGFAKLVRLKGEKNFAGTQWQLIYK
jgi:DNA-binding MarR family transcriptional regulator